MKNKQKNYFVIHTTDQIDSNVANKPTKKKMNIFLKILIVLLTFPLFFIYPFFFIFKSKKLKIKSKLIFSIIYLIPLSVFFYILGNTNPALEEQNQQIVLVETKLELYQGQMFDPLVYIGENTSEEIMSNIEISNPVNVNKPGNYTVTYKYSDEEKLLEVVVMEDPITLDDDSIVMELGTSFDPEENIDPLDKEKYDIQIINNVDLATPGIYTVVYKFKDIEKSINVTITKPKTIDYTLSHSEWLFNTTKELGYLKNIIIDVDGGDTSSSRQSNVAVDVGFGTREYWAYTNEYGQLVAVIAEKIILQDESTEILLGDGRYYTDEADVPGTEKIDLDNGHVIADSLGGVSNAYNITPQNSTLNRKGDQAYMEEWIQKANGADNFIAIITYPNATTQIPSHYSFSYIINGNKVTDEFDNKNPEATVNNSSDNSNINPLVGTPNNETNSESIEGIDTNGNGTVTIAEAKAAGFKMPIRSDHWLYKYMRDGDNDGMVGE